MSASYVGSGLQSAQNLPARETHVQSQMGRQGQLISELTERIQQVEIRLVSVLRGQPPAPTGKGEGKTGPSLVGHAVALSNQNDQLEALGRQVAELLDRIEL